jgi:uncharacterized membrane protein (UPF0136 family)
MKKCLIVTTLYTILVFAGGVIGYSKAGSIPSLVASIISGAILTSSIIGFALKKRWALLLALATTLILDAFFTYRLITTKHFIPAGLMSLISSLVLLLLALFWRQNEQRKK